MIKIIIIFALAFAACAEDAPKLPYEAQQAVDAMDAQISKARQECLKKMDKIIGDITKTGNLELAIVCKNKEKEIQDQMPKVDLLGEAQPASIVGKWTRGPGFIYEYKDDQTFNSSNVKSGKWSVVGPKFIVTWDNGQVDTFVLPIKNNVLNGTRNNGAAIIITKVIAK